MSIEGQKIQEQYALAREVSPEELNSMSSEERISHQRSLVNGDTWMILYTGQSKASLDSYRAWTRGFSSLNSLTLGVVRSTCDRVGVCTYLEFVPDGKIAPNKKIESEPPRMTQHERNRLKAENNGGELGVIRG